MGSTFAERMAGINEEDEVKNTPSASQVVPSADTTQSSSSFASRMAQGNEDVKVVEPLLKPTPTETQTEQALPKEDLTYSEYDTYMFGDEYAAEQAAKYSDAEKYHPKLASKLADWKEGMLKSFESGEVTQTAEMLSEQNVVAKDSELYTLDSTPDHPFYKDIANDFNGDGVVTKEDALIKRFKGKQEELTETGEDKFIPTEDLQSTDLKTLEDRVVFKQAERADRIAERVQGMLNSENVVTRKLANQLIESDMSLVQIRNIVGIDEFLDPFTAVAEVPIHYRNIQENISKGEYGGAAGNAALGLLDLSVAKVTVKPIIGAVNFMWKAVGSGGKHSRTVNAVANETAEGRKVIEANRSLANENKETRTQLIREWEARNDVNISDVVDDAGNLEINTGKTRDTGRETLSDYYEAALAPDGTDLKLLDDISIGDDPLLIPMMNPNKLDALTNIVSDLQKANPEYFKNLYHPKKNPSGVRMIDKIFELTVDKKLLETEDLHKMLTKYGMSYDDYILGVVGSASEAGKLLASVSHMKRVRPLSVKEISEAKAAEASAEGIRKFWQTAVLRPEGIRRGLMVSSLATAARNLTSAGIRAPMESLGNVMDTALLTYSQKSAQEGGAAGIKAAFNSVNPLVRDGTYVNSFRNLRYIFADQGTAEQFTDYILDRPEFAQQFSRMFDSIGELQQAAGRGQATSTIGKGADAILSRGEDIVQALNAPNRWQDHMVRRATFYSELQRITKNEWGIDLQDALDQGKLKQIMNDNVGEGLRPKDGRSFVSIVDDATRKALDVTYSKQPDLKAFRTISNGITKSGLTVIVPFPRFMFNGLELMAQYSGGAALPLIRKASGGNFGKGLTTRDREDITRNMVGFATMYGLYRASESEYATDKSYEFKDPDTGKKLDTTPQFPIRQLALAAKLGAAAINGTFGAIDGVTGTEFANPNMTMENDTEFTYKNLAETFLGSSARTGQGNVIIDEMAAFLKGIDDPTDAEAFAKKLGRFSGQLASTYLIPLRQLNDAQRAIGIRGTEYKDFNKDPRITKAEMRLAANKRLEEAEALFKSGSEEDYYKNNKTRFEQLSEEGNVGYLNVSELSDLDMKYASDEEMQADINLIQQAQGIQTGGQTFSKEFRRGFYQQGFVAPSVEEAQPTRQFLHTDSSKRINVGTRLIAGLNFKEADSKEVEFLKSIGYGDPTYELGSRNRNKKMQAKENAALRERLPLIVNVVKNVVEMDGYKEGSKEYYIAAKKHTSDMVGYIKGITRTENSNAVQGASDKLRRMKNVDLKYAIQEFKKARGENPNLGSLRDLETLLEYGKAKARGN
tara:strand:- start:33 stop:3977 length:3945 start_codon:yes stop_codon:yes gene_type:complete